MKPLHYILISIAIVYLLMGGIFLYLSLSYRKQFKRIRKASNIIIRDVNESLTTIVNELTSLNLTMNYVPFTFASDNDDLIETDRAVIYAAIEKAKEKAIKQVNLVQDQRSHELIRNEIATIEDNLANYRRLVIKHNKIVDNYNFNARSIFFVIFVIIISMKKEKHI